MTDKDVRELVEALADELSARVVERVLGALQQPGGPADGAAVFRQEGEYWTLVYDGTLTRLRDCRGLHHLARLLARPNEHVHVLELTSGTGAAHRESGLDVLDAPARAAYRRRLHDLEEAVEDAARCGDLLRQQRADAERDFLVQELSRALGLGGRGRRTCDATERARVAVTKAVRGALVTISTHHPALGAHLHHTVRTGTFCTYCVESAPVWEC